VTVKKLVLSLLVVCILFFSSITLYAGFNNSTSVVEAVTLSWGSRGDNVRTMQTKLKEWGYYDGAVDGIFGSLTYQAVRDFQRRNGLQVDGVVGPATQRALGVNFGAAATPDPAPSPQAPQENYEPSRGGTRDSDVQLMARAINGEARGEPYIGQVAVGAVILNRVKSPDFPNTIPGVIYQPLAFTAVADGQINAAMEEDSLRAARDALNGWDPSGGALYYYNPAKATSRWIWRIEVTKVIGKHHFGKGPR
jgi:N-acetylmuramoyl-L-alanine amidase